MSTLYYTDVRVLGRGYMTPKSTIEGANSNFPRYPLLVGDGLIKMDDSLWRKDFEGVCIEGFLIEDESLLESYDDYHFRRLNVRSCT